MTNVTPVPPEPPTNGFVMSPALYDKVRALVQTILPALSTLYFALGAIWGFPNVEQVVGTVAALITFGGVMLTLSRKTYNASDARFDGKVIIETTESGGKMYSLELNDASIDDIEHKKSLAFKVDPQQK